MRAWTPRAPAPDEPACWSWPVPPLRDPAEEIERYTRLQEGLRLDPDHRLEPDAVVGLLDDAAASRFTEFHTGARLEPLVWPDARCAVCGRADRLVDDHCHDTGQIRGYLCRGCNTAEGRSDHPLFVRYRRIHPAAILDHHELYSGPGWTMGWSWVVNPGEADSYIERPSEPWKAWDPDWPLDRGLPGAPRAAIEDAAERWRPHRSKPVRL